jgi:hypothetical protein
VVSAEGSTRAEKLAVERGWSQRRIMAGSPHTRAAAREAVRRAAGGAATLVLDGDVALQAGFLRPAMAVLAERDNIAGVGGRIDEAHWRGGAMIGGRRDVEGTGEGGATRRLRDVALWRREALDAVGGYDVWLPAGDDEELAGRLRMAGYAAVALDVTAGVRHGVARDTGRDFSMRLRSGAMNGPGLMLRRSRGTMAFGEHLGRSAGRLGLVFWVLAGVLGAWFGHGRGLASIWVWTSVGLLVFFAVLRGSPARVFWQGLSALSEGLGILRNLVAPVALRRVGPAPRPIPPPKDRPVDAAARGADDGRPEGDPDDPPPIVRRG